VAGVPVRSRDGILAVKTEKEPRCFGF